MASASSSKDMEVDTLFVSPRRQFSSKEIVSFESRKDFQGIPWRMLDRRREDYRLNRLALYRRDHRLDSESKEVLHGLPTPSRDEKYYKFYCTARKARPGISHFQLRHLISSPYSRTLVTFLSKNGVHQLHTPTLTVTQLLKFESEFVLEGGHHICSLLRWKDLLFVGSFQGHVIAKHLDAGRYTHDEKWLPKDGKLADVVISEGKDNICNALTMTHTAGGAPAIVVSNNDQCVKLLDLQTFKPFQTFSTKWAVNHSSIRPLGQEKPEEKSHGLMVVVGDAKEALLVDIRTNKVSSKLEGHTDFSFGTAWDPIQPHLATANQDQTCRVWDIRKVGNGALATLGGRMASVRAVQYSHNGKYLGFSEAADFVHLYNTQDFKRSQEIDIFGEIAGFCFSQDDESLFIGITDCYYGCVMEWHTCDE